MPKPTAGGVGGAEKKERVVSIITSATETTQAKAAKVDTTACRQHTGNVPLHLHLLPHPHLPKVPSKT